MTDRAWAIGLRIVGGCCVAVWIAWTFTTRAFPTWATLLLGAGALAFFWGGFLASPADAKPSIRYMALGSVACAAGTAVLVWLIAAAPEG